MTRWIKRLALGTCAVIFGLLLVLAGLYAFLSRADGELVSSGETRRYLLHVPPGYDPEKPSALVISLHGAWLYPGMQQRLTGWSALADEEGFIVVYPRAAGFPRVWHLEPGPGLSADVRFIEDLIDELSAEYNIDPNRIYANGYSNGAAMTFMLSCTLPERIAAFGMVATAIVPWDWCRERRPVPMLAFQGTADPFVPFEGGENFLTSAPLSSMREWFALWGERNRCSSGPVETDLAADIGLWEYGDCAQGASTRFYTLRGKGHVWPGGLRLPEFGTGPHTDDIDAAREMWSHFRRYSLQATAPE
jgi:polyhydroxybutyrate depolymerase